MSGQLPVSYCTSPEPLALDDLPESPSLLPERRTMYPKAGGFAAPPHTPATAGSTVQTRSMSDHKPNVSPQRSRSLNTLPFDGLSDLLWDLTAALEAIANDRTSPPSSHTNTSDTSLLSVKSTAELPPPTAPPDASIATTSLSRDYLSALPATALRMVFSHLHHTHGLALAATCRALHGWRTAALATLRFPAGRGDPMYTHFAASLVGNCAHFFRTDRGRIVSDAVRSVHVYDADEADDTWLVRTPQNEEVSEPETQEGERDVDRDSTQEHARAGNESSNASAMHCGLNEIDFDQTPGIPDEQEGATVSGEGRSADIEMQANPDPQANEDDMDVDQLFQGITFPPLNEHTLPLQPPTSFYLSTVSDIDRALCHVIVMCRQLRSLVVDARSAGSLRTWSIPFTFDTVLKHDRLYDLALLNVRVPWDRYLDREGNMVPSPVNHSLIRAVIRGGQTLYHEERARPQGNPTTQHGTTYKPRQARSRFDIEAEKLSRDNLQMGKRIIWAACLVVNREEISLLDVEETFAGVWPGRPEEGGSGGGEWVRLISKANREPWKSLKVVNIRTEERLLQFYQELISTGTLLRKSLDKRRARAFSHKVQKRHEAQGRVFLIDFTMDSAIISEELIKKVATYAAVDEEHPSLRFVPFVHFSQNGSQIESLSLDTQLSTDALSPMVDCLRRMSLRRLRLVVHPDDEFWHIAVGPHGALGSLFSKLLLLEELIIDCPWDVLKSECAYPGTLDEWTAVIALAPQLKTFTVAEALISTLIHQNTTWLAHTTTEEHVLSENGVDSGYCSGSEEPLFNLPLNDTDPAPIVYHEDRLETLARKLFDCLPAYGNPSMSEVVFLPQRSFWAKCSVQVYRRGQSGAQARPYKRFWEHDWREWEWMPPSPQMKSSEQKRQGA
ncbi:hypothetical protein ACG7TL_007716 [Trametes sanguinea]